MQGRKHANNIDQAMFIVVVVVVFFAFLLWKCLFCLFSMKDMCSTLGHMQITVYQL